MKVRMINEPDLANTTGYAHRFYKGFSDLRTDVDFMFFSRNDERKSEAIPMKCVWSSRTFPFAVWKQCLIERPDILHIQFAFDTFGDFLDTFLFTAMLVLLKTLKLKIVINVHATIPLNVVTPDFIHHGGFPNRVSLRGRAR